MKFSRNETRRISQGPTSADVALEPVLPYPDGWFAVAFTGELGRTDVLTRPLQGEDVVLYRVGDGSVRAIRPYCPHLGAHLGLGRVDGGELICPFHSFAFDPDGSCVRTPYGKPPPKAGLDRLPVREVNGVVFVWRHHDGRPPYWEIPPWHAIGHLPPRYTSWELAGHSQEVMENAVDLGHFATLHEWLKAELASPVSFGKETFHASMRALEMVPLAGRITVEVEVDGYGISCLHADMYIPKFGLRMCTMVMATMITPNRLQLRQSNRVQFSEPRWLPKLPARQVSRSLTRLLAGPLFKGSCDFTAADFPIWDTKKYLPLPRLAPGDGPIGSFRHWARQFYPQVPTGRLPPAPDALGPGRIVRARGGDG